MENFIKGFFILMFIGIIVENINFIINVLFTIIFLIMLIYICISFYKKMKKKRKIKRIINSGIDKIDKMTGIEFEKFLEHFMQKLGYKIIKRTNKTGDFGADLIIKDNTDMKIAVQAKRHKNKVSLRAVQEVSAAKGYYDCPKGMVITNSHLTHPAKQLARKNNIEYWERNTLIKKLNKAK